MLNTIKTPVMFLTLAFLVLLSKVSYSGVEGDYRSPMGKQGIGGIEGPAHHGHDFHSHANPDLTLISGMDNIDRRVLIASNPDQTSEALDQPVQVVETTMPTTMIGSGMEDGFTVNIPNSSGGYTPVIIKKWGNGYLGPQGELYFPFPEVSQLKAMYGI